MLEDSTNGGLLLGGDFYFKDFREATTPARYGRVYLWGSVRIEPCFHGRANVAKHLPPLHRILDTDPRAIWLRHVRWRRYRPRLLKRKLEVQKLKARPRKPMTGIWETLLCDPPPRIQRMTVVESLHLDDIAFVWA